MASKRVVKELKDLQNDHSVTSFTAGPVGEDLFHWEATIFGPPDSPMQEVFSVLISRYRGTILLNPLRGIRLQIAFTTKVFHPSIASNGQIWLDTMYDQWSPALTISKMLLSICSLLTDPNLENILEPEIATMYKTDRVKYESTARSWTQKYAMG